MGRLAAHRDQSLERLKQILVKHPGSTCCPGVSRSRSEHFLPLLISAVLGTASSACHFGKNYTDAPVNRRSLFVAFAWFGSLAIFAGTAKYADFQNRFTCWMCMRSFGL